MGHTFFQHLYHIVFSTAKREPWLTKGIRSDCHSYLGGIARNLEMTVLHAGGVSDHVHLLAAVPPKIALSEMVQKVKANSSGWIKREHGLAGFAWQAGYASFTVSPSKQEQVAAYIQNQEAHHARMSYADELKGLLEKHGIEFDPAYYLD